MARFLAAIEGQSGKEVHRLGSPNSGVRAQAQGWDIGVKVMGHVHFDQDVFNIYITGGSNGSGGLEFIGTVKLAEDGNTPVFVNAYPESLSPAT